ncbi:MAG: MauE/DoxX family redox-associated membrane protein [Planctomycetota bacterium]
MPDTDSRFFAGASAASTFQSALSLIARITLAQLFFIAALNKITDPQSFATAISKFQVPGFILEEDSQNALVVVSVFLVPWLELVAALFLIAGLYTRAAASVLIALLAVFCGAIYSVIAREIEITDCGCFGDLKGICRDAVGTCNLVQNGVLAALGLIALIVGGGRASADALFDPQGGPDAEADPDDADDEIDFA